MKCFWEMCHMYYETNLNSEFEYVQFKIKE